MGDFVLIFIVLIIFTKRGCEIPITIVPRRFTEFGGRFMLMCVVYHHLLSHKCSATCNISKA